MRVNWTPRAEADLIAIHEYIAADSPVNAMRVVNRLIARVRQLHTFARSGRVVPELGEETIREVIEAPYRVIYRILAGRIEIVTVMQTHGWCAGRRTERRQLTTASRVRALRSSIIPFSSRFRA